MSHESQAGPADNAPEQGASAARPWQAAQGKSQARGEPRPDPQVAAARRGRYTSSDDGRS
jgi:hypothetical protein